MPLIKTRFPEGLPPISVEVLKVNSLATHWRDEISCMWVLEGHVDIYESYLMYHLTEGDIFVINYNTPVKLISEEGCKLAFVYFDAYYFSKHIPNLREVNFAHYYFSKAHDLEGALENIYRFISALFVLLEDAGPGGRSASKIETMATFFIKVLIDTFQYSYYQKDESGTYLNMLDRSPDLSQEQIGRLQRLTYYIWQNSSGGITLDDVAEQNYYSRFYVSHFIRKAYGLSFQETVALTRAVTSERLLIDTDYSLEQIASAVGFSNRSQYCDQFKKWHGIPPSQYRRENKPGAPGNKDIAFPLNDEEARRLLDVK